MFEIQHFTKIIDDKVILNDCSGFFEDGHMVFIVGEKHAGKTTLLKCIANLEPHEGSTTFLPDTKVVYYEDNLNIPGSLTGRQFMRLMLEKQRLSKQECLERIVEVCDNVGLRGAILDVPAKTYTIQEKKRLQLAKAILDNADVCLFDGLTDVFDENDFLDMRRILNKLCKRSTVVVTTEDYDMPRLFNGSLKLLDEGRLVEMEEVEV